MNTKLNLVVLLTFAATVVSCNKFESNPPEESKPIIEEKFFLTKPYAVEVREGSVTRVTLGEERLAFTDIPMTIDIPKTVATRAGDDLKVEFLPYAQIPEFTKGTGISEKTHVLMFEDSRKGDYDYNDFVVLVKHSVRTFQAGATYSYGYDFVVKPLALGATKSIKFGYVDENSGKAVYFSENIKKDYFENTDAMINTSKNAKFKAPISDAKNEHIYLAFNGPDFERTILESFNKTQPGADLIGGYYKYMTYVKPIANLDVLKTKVNYFIEVGNVKIYIAEVNSGSGAQLPYGLAIPSSIKTYPFESQSISEVFPLFDAWIATPDSHLDWYKNGSNGFNVDLPALYRWYPAYYID